MPHALRGASREHEEADRMIIESGTCLHDDCEYDAEDGEQYCRLHGGEVREPDG